jgi:hypothetical protein
MKYLGYFFMALIPLAVFFMVSISNGAPTPPQDTLTWDDPDNTPGAVAGYYMYYALEQEPAPREYGDTRREDLGMPTNLSASVKSALPQAKGMMCFRLTAYDHLKNESPFSNETCGFQGMGNPKNLSAK